ncbi:hypothetical protein GQ457_06G016140 [Hibiscus cannabinus]
MGVICFSRHQNQFQVSEYSRPLERIVQNNYVVDLRHRTCDCGIFQTFKYLCAHIFAACTSVYFDVMTLVDSIYRLQTVFKVYRNKFPPIENERDVNMIDNEVSTAKSFHAMRPKLETPLNPYSLCE